METKMKIIEGTPEEIKKYLSEKENISVSDVGIKPTPKEFGKYLKTKNLKNELHWSRNKSEWIYIKDMDSAYIVNILRQKLNSDSAIALLEDREFKSLIINLSDKITE